MKWNLEVESSSSWANKQRRDIQLNPPNHWWQGTFSKHNPMLWKILQLLASWSSSPPVECSWIQRKLSLWSLSNGQCGSWKLLLIAFNMENNAQRLSKKAVKTSLLLDSGITKCLYPIPSCQASLLLKSWEMKVGVVTGWFSGWGLLNTGAKTWEHLDLGFQAQLLEL